MYSIMLLNVPCPHSNRQGPSNCLKGLNFSPFTSSSASVFDMRLFFSLSLCAVAGLVRLANAAEGQCLSELCYDTTANLNARTEPTSAMFNPKLRTNAERMALGLLPNPPSRRHRAGKISVYCGPIHVHACSTQILLLARNHRRHRKRHKQV